MISFALFIVFCHPYASTQLCEPGMHIRPKPGEAGNRALIALAKEPTCRPTHRPTRRPTRTPTRWPLYLPPAVVNPTPSTGGPS